MAKPAYLAAEGARVDNDAQDDLAAAMLKHAEPKSTQQYSSCIEEQLIITRWLAPDYSNPSISCVEAAMMFHTASSVQFCQSHVLDGIQIKGKSLPGQNRPMQGQMSTAWSAGKLFRSAACTAAICLLPANIIGLGWGLGAVLSSVRRR